METVWVFNGANSSFPSAVFAVKEDAIEYIRKYKLTGILTEYPLGISVYDWAIKESLFYAKRSYETDSVFIGSFSSAHQDHYHFENGRSHQLPEDWEYNKLLEKQNENDEKE